MNALTPVGAGIHDTPKFSQEHLKHPLNIIFLSIYHHNADFIGFLPVSTNNLHLLGISEMRRRTSSIVILLYSF